MNLQNADTTFEYMEMFIHWMYENNFFINDGIIYDTIDVCSKQYICQNSMRQLSVLEFTHRVIIDIYIHDPCHGRSKKYVILAHPTSNN